MAVDADYAAHRKGEFLAAQYQRAVELEAEGLRLATHHRSDYKRSPRWERLGDSEKMPRSPGEREGKQPRRMREGQGGA